MSSKARKRLLVVIVLLGAIVGSYFVARQVRRTQHLKTVADEKQAGLDYYGTGDYENALPHLRYYVRANKDDAEILLILAECRLNVPLENFKHIREGRNLLTRAASPRPDDPEPLTRLINLYEQLGYYTERLESCEKLLKFDPDNLFAIEATVESLRQIGNRDLEALSFVAQWIALDPANPIAHQWHIWLESLIGTSSLDLVKYAEEQRTNYPESMGFANLYAKSLASDHQMEEAKTAILAAKDLDASNSDEIRIILTPLSVRLRISS